MVTLKGTGAASEELFCVQVTFQVGCQRATGMALYLWYLALVAYMPTLHSPHACKQVVAGALTAKTSSALDALQQSRRLLAV